MSKRNSPAGITGRRDDAVDLRPSRLRRVEVRDVNSPSPTRTPIAKRPASPRVTFSQTRTLTGAFESTAPPPNYNTSRDAKTSRTSPEYAITRSPRADILNSTPRESHETYRGFEEGVGLADPAEGDPLSPTPSPRHRNSVLGRYDNESVDDFLQYAMEGSAKRRQSQYAMDQQRLRRETTRNTPVLSRANGGRKGRASNEEFPRRNEKQEENKEEEDFGGHMEPALNVPKSWGSRGKLSRDMVERMNRENEVEHLDNEADRGWDDDLEFTARSFQVSDSPPMRHRVQSYEAKPSPPVKAKTSPSPQFLEEEKAPTQESVAHGDESRGSPIPNTPIVVYPNSNREKLQTVHREDSRELLRKLARKESPSASNTPEQKNVDDTISNMKTPVVMGAWIDTPAPERIASPPTVQENEETPKQSRTTIKPKAEPEPEPVQAEPEPPKPASHAFSRISPRKQTRVEPRSRLRPRYRPRPRPELKKPSLPKSGLDAVIQDAKAGDDQSLVLGESTIDSLQDLIKSESGLPEVKDFAYPERKPSESDKEEDRSKDGATTPPKRNEAVIDRLNGKLVSLVSNIKEVRDGLTTLETQATQDATDPKFSRKRKPTKGSHSCAQGKPCEACGLAGDGRLYFALPLPRFWKRSPATNRIRLTLLGWSLLILFFWYVSEVTMCEFYCHPLYLSPGKTYVVDPNAPRMPWVLPTMLWRWSHLSTILAPIWAIIVAFFRLVAQILGYWDGFVDTPSATSGSAFEDVSASFEKARQGYVPPPEPAVEFNAPVNGMWEQENMDQDLSMQADEVL